MLTRRSSKAVAGLSLLACAFGLLFLRTASAVPQDLNSLYERAKSEGALALYTGGPTALKNMGGVR